ncbi:atypical chemokine receptor 2-like [Xenentodon cancila]
MAFSSDYDYEYTIFHNDSDVNMVEDHIELSAFQIYVAVCATLIFCISMAGNSFLLQVLLKERAWIAPSDILLLQFTVSNLVFTATLPFLACNALHGWIFGEWACGVMRGLTVLGLNSSVMILTAMAFHCYVTVVQTSRLSALYSSTFRVVVTSIIVWLVCSAVSIRPAVNSRVVKFEVLVLVGVIEHTRDWSDGAHYADYIIFTLAHFYCCLNPLAHIFGAQRFRRHLPVLRFCSVQSGDGNNNATSVPFNVLHNDDV